MTKQSVATIKAQNASIIKENNNQEITPIKDKTLRDNAADSFANLKDGGMSFEAAVGYLTSLSVTNPNAFVALFQAEAIAAASAAGVDLSAYFKKDGSIPMEGAIDAGGNGITNVTDIKDTVGGLAVGVEARTLYDYLGRKLLDFYDRDGGLQLHKTDSVYAKLDPSLLSEFRNYLLPNKDITIAGIDDILAAIINTAYGAVWNGDTTHTPSADVLYDKLAALDSQITALSLYLGKFVSLVALQTAYPASTSGHWAIVDPGSGIDAKEYLWDDEEGWVLGSGTAGVTSVFGRTGVVTAQSGDYTSAQITEVTNLFFTNARAITALLTAYSAAAGTVSSSDSIIGAIQKLDGNIAALTTNSTKLITSTQSGNGILTTFNVAHGLSGTPTHITAIANTSDAVGITYVSADATNVIITYSIAPPTGTNNLKYSVTAKL